MPAMPRTSSKATAIAYAILGKPAGMQKQSVRQQKTDKVLRFQRLDRIR